MLRLNFFGSMPKLNFGGDKTKSKKSTIKKEQDASKSNRAVGGETSDANKEQTNDKSEGTVEEIGALSEREMTCDMVVLETKDEAGKDIIVEDVAGTSENDQRGFGNATVVDVDNQLKELVINNQIVADSNTLIEDEEESRDKFEMQNTTFYRVLTKSFYEHNLNILKPFQKKDDDGASTLKSTTKRTKKTTRSLRDRKLIISSPQNFQRVENEMTLLLRTEAENMRLGTLKKSASLDNLLRDSGERGGDFSSDFSDRFGTLQKEKVEFSSMRDLMSLKVESETRSDELGGSDSSLNSEKKKELYFADTILCSTCGGDHSVPILPAKAADNKEAKNANSGIIVTNGDDENASVLSSSEEDIDKVVEEYISNLVAMRNKSQSTPELLKSINQIPKDRIERPPENKFPLDDENVEIRRRPSIPRNRMSKTTDFDLGRRKQDSPINPKNFDIRGIVKFQLPNNTIITKLNQEYVAYENENFYRINDKTKAKVTLAHNVTLKLVRYINSRSKESKEVELKDTQNLSYILYFDSIKYAKQFMENEKIQSYVSDNKITIKKTLLRFLGKRSSREILEKKGIYKNEPIFGNTLRDINVKGAANFGSPVPLFIYRVIELIEKPENIKSLGLYRTSGNLATIQKIRFEVDNGRLEILDQFFKDPDVLTGSLKLFFRELKEPLISCDVCEKLTEITRLDPKQMSSKDHQKIRSTLTKNLHEANVETFYVVMRHLLEVIKNKEHNKMDAYNLAVCWGPSMIFSVHGATTYQNFELSKDIVTQSHDATRLVDFLLGYYQLHPWELDGLSKRPESVTDKILALKRQESRDSVESSDSSKSQKKSSSNLSLSIDEITKKLIEIIEPNLSTEGLYKKPGSPDKTNKIMKKLNKKKIHELDKYKTDVHEMTDALKRYLREQEGLVTKEIVESVLKATSDNSQNYMEATTRRKVTSLIEEAPKKDTLVYLLRHLGKVIDHQTRHKVSKNDIIGVWTDVLDHQRKCHVSYEEFGKFLTVAVEVFNDNLPDIVRSSFNNNGGSPNRNDIMGEVVKQMKHQQERDRNSRYDNVDCDVSGEASVLDEKTEQTKL